MTSFIQFWARETWLAHVRSRSLMLEHTAGNRFDRVRPGDTVYVLGREADELLVLARIVATSIGEILVGGSQSDALFTQEQAEGIRQRPLWEARHHLLAREGTTTPLQFNRILPETALRNDPRGVRSLAPDETSRLELFFESSRPVTRGETPDR